MNPNVRRPTETQADFKARRRIEAKLEKIRAQGRVIWDSGALGTYRRPKSAVSIADGLDITVHE